MKNTKVLLVILMLVPFILLPLYSFFIVGVFSWHISVKEYWNDLLEIAVYVSLIGLLGLLFKEKRSVILFFVAGIYLISVGTFVPICSSYCYIECICIVGNVVLNVFNYKLAHIYTFLVGSVVVGAVFIAASVIGVGTIDDLRYIFIVLILIIFVISKNKINLKESYLAKISDFVKTLNKQEWLIFVYIVAVGLLAFSRVNTHIESDSSWYALYTDKNLFGDKSFYDFLGYTGFIYYYPKFKELLMAPITGLGEAGYLISSNLWLLVFMADETFRYIRKKCSQNRSSAIFIVAMIYSTMVVVGTAGTAKSDTLGYLYLLLCWISFDEFVVSKKDEYLWFSVAAGILPIAVKYTHYLWMLCMFVGFASKLITMRFRGDLPKLKTNNLYIGGGLILGALSIIVGVTSRTILLTGLPFGRLALNLVNDLGFNGRTLFQYSANTELPSVFKPERIINSFFFVGDAEKITAQWFGNYLIYFSVVVLIMLPFKIVVKSVKENLYQFITLMMMNLFAIYLLVTMYAPDGNYFELQVILSTIYVAVLLGENDIKQKDLLFKIQMIFFIMLNFVMYFTVDPSWGCATRFSVPRKLVMTSYDNRKYVDSLIEYMGAKQIDEYLSKNDNDSLIIIDGGETFLTCMNARIEMSKDITNNYISAYNIDNDDSFEEYIRLTGVKGFILGRDFDKDKRFEAFAMNYLNKYGYEIKLEDDKYIYYKLY